MAQIYPLQLLIASLAGWMNRRQTEMCYPETKDILRRARPCGLSSTLARLALRVEPSWASSPNA